MDFKQLMGSMASGMGSGMMDKQMAQAYNGAQSGFTDPLRGKQVGDMWQGRNMTPDMIQDQQELAQLKADRSRGRAPKMTQPVRRPLAGPLEGGE